VKSRRRPKRPNQRGTVAVLTAAGLLLFLGLVGLGVDLGHLYLVKGELQRAADAGAMAGARALFFPANSAPPQCSQATTLGAQIARTNIVDGSPSVLSNIQTGYWDWKARTFSPGCSSDSATYTTAVTLTTTNMVTLAFMGAWGFGPLTLSSRATSSVGFVGRVPPGTIPVALSKNAYKIGNQVKINFTGTDNGGWFVPSGYSSSASALADYINENNPLPALNVGDTINLNNGAVSSALSALAKQLASRGNHWTTFLPAVDTTSFNQSIPINGFVAFTLTNVKTGNNAAITGVVSDYQEASGPGYILGGPPFNVVGEVKLVN